MDSLTDEVSQESSWPIMLAEDIVICSDSTEQVVESLQMWKPALRRRLKLKIPRSKTQYITCVGVILK